MSWNGEIYKAVRSAMLQICPNIYQADEVPSDAPGRRITMALDSTGVGAVDYPALSVQVFEETADGFDAASAVEDMADDVERVLDAATFTGPWGAVAFYRDRRGKITTSETTVKRRQLQFSGSAVINR